MKLIKSALLYIWQFPQNLLAFIIYSIMSPLCTFGGLYFGKKVVLSNSFISSFSLGDYLFIKSTSPEEIYIHELGHSIQSLRLGWFYLPFIALPSLIHNVFRRVKKRFLKGDRLREYSKTYYEFYTERWASELGVNEVFNRDKRK